MKRSLMRWALTLEGPVSVPDGAGGAIAGWQARGVVHASLEPLTGREALAGAAGVSRVPYRIIVAAAPEGAPSRPGPRDRFRHGTRVFEILAVSAVGAAGQFLECRAIEEVTV
ncbi:phage tail protein [Meridianimarinicoccus roseus]|uniref:Phage tail protein n=1 Tax=Meridianimarinicoccus roseus TaxID=2072018 RepID=A0A2V2LGJ4_9RHOB|nr:head-tail adaptor protein [Meridianimarinicoccus roseus]PWR03051.1 phage tail protein [Meridianimarinicoccus roseus]